MNFGYFDGSIWVATYWKNLYSLVASSNDACSKIYRLRNSGTLVESENQQLDQMIGECNFLRGLGYFYLTRSFGDKLPSHPEYKPEELGVPIVDTLVVSKDQLLKSRNTLGECWGEIIKDFETAYNLLPASWNAEKLGAMILSEVVDVSGMFTDDMLIILEGETEPMEKMLKDSPRLSKVFNHVIRIKQYDIKEWVEYGKRYAKDKGYVMEELASLAFYKAIDDYF